MLASYKTSQPRVAVLRKSPGQLRRKHQPDTLPFRLGQHLVEHFQSFRMGMSDRQRRAFFPGVVKGQLKLFADGRN